MSSHPMSGSDDKIQPSEHRPRGERSVTLLLMGKLMNQQGEALCRIRNLSHGGLMAEVHVPLSIGDAVQLQLHGHMSLSGVVRWTSDGRMGLQFDNPVDVALLLRRDQHNAQDRLPRHLPQFAVDCPAELRLYGRSFAVRLTHITQAGVVMESDAACASGPLVTLAVPGLPDCEGGLMPECGGQCGLSFTQPLAFHDLALWLAQNRWGGQRSPIGLGHQDSAILGISQRKGEGPPKRRFTPVRRSS